MGLERHLTTVLAAVVVSVAVSGCGGARGTDIADTFGYDASEPLDVVDTGVINAPYPVEVHDVSYASGDDRVEAYLVVPPGEGRKPAVLYLHPQSSDRTTMLEAALWMAARGAVTMTITAPSIREEPQDLPPREALERFGAQAEGDVIAARRALDLLAERPDVDPDRLAVAGWSAGARAAALLAGADERVRAAALLAPGAAPVSEFVAAAPPDLRDAVEEVMGRIDPFAAIAATDAALLVQAARQDSVVPSSAIEALVAAAPESVELRWYHADHALNEAAYREHMDWLEKRLEVAGPPVPGARTGP